MYPDRVRGISPAGASTGKRCNTSLGETCTRHGCCRKHSVCPSHTCETSSMARKGFSRMALGFPVDPWVRALDPRTNVVVPVSRLHTLQHHPRTHLGRS